MCTWVQGFEGATVHAALVAVMRQSRPPDGRGEYEWCRELADKAEKEPGLVASMLREALVDQMAAVLNAQLRALRAQVHFRSLALHCPHQSRRACPYQRIVSTSANCACQRVAPTPANCAYQRIAPTWASGGVAIRRWRCSHQVPAGRRDGKGPERQVHAGTRPASLHQSNAFSKTRDVLRPRNAPLDSINQVMARLEKYGYDSSRENHVACWTRAENAAPDSQTRVMKATLFA